MQPPAHKQDLSPLVFEIEDKIQFALDLRLGGATFRQIAKQMDISVSTAHYYITQALERKQQHTEARRDELREIELRRLEALWLRFWPRVNERGVNDFLLRVSFRRAKLMGLDLPVLIEGAPVGNPSGFPVDKDGKPLTEEQIEKRLAELIELGKEKPAVIEGVAEPAGPLAEVDPPEPPAAPEPAPTPEPEPVPLASTPVETPKKSNRTKFPRF